MVDREESVGGQGLAAVANLAFKKRLRSQRAMEAAEAVEVKVAEAIEAKTVPLLALQQARALHTLK